MQLHVALAAAAEHCVRLSAFRPQHVANTLWAFAAAGAALTTHDADQEAARAQHGRHEPARDGLSNTAPGVARGVGRAPAAHARRAARTRVPVHRLRVAAGAVHGRRALEFVDEHVAPRVQLSLEGPPAVAGGRRGGGGGAAAAAKAAAAAPRRPPRAAARDPARLGAEAVGPPPPRRRVLSPGAAGRQARRFSRGRW